MGLGYFILVIQSGCASEEQSTAGLSEAKY